MFSFNLAYLTYHNLLQIIHLLPWIFSNDNMNGWHFSMATLPTMFPLEVLGTFLWLSWRVAHIATMVARDLFHLVKLRPGSGGCLAKHAYTSSLFFCTILKVQRMSHLVVKDSSSRSNPPILLCFYSSLLNHSLFTNSPESCHWEFWCTLYNVWPW